MTKARLYYEAHVTVESRDALEDMLTDPWGAFKLIAHSCGWRPSKFSEDEVDDYHGKWFLSWRGEDLDATITAVRAMVGALRRGGYEVLRWKIEDTVYDSKHGDLPQMMEVV